MKVGIKLWQSLFRLLGLLLILGGLYAAYDFGKDLLPQFEDFVAGTLDPFDAAIVIVSFFLGAPALMWVGTRALFLRSFRESWLFYAAFPAMVWLEEVYGIEQLFEMDRLLTQGVMFFFTYWIIVYIAFFVHRNWFSPLSHEKMGHVGLEGGRASEHPFLDLFLVAAIVWVLLFLHPADFSTTIDMLLSPFQWFIDLV